MGVYTKWDKMTRLLLLLLLQKSHFPRHVTVQT